MSQLRRTQRAMCAVMAVLALLSETNSLRSERLPALALPLLLLSLDPRGLLNTWPNVLTLLRTTFPWVHALWPVNDGRLRCAMGLAFVLLDFVDGALARALRTTSTLGAVLDEEADAFGTLVASAEIARQGVAPRWLAFHQGCAHYVFITVQDLCCPEFDWHLPFARLAAGVMGVCLIGACVCAELGAPTVAYALGTLGTTVNALSFALSYAHMVRAIALRRGHRAVRVPGLAGAGVGASAGTSAGAGVVAGSTSTCAHPRFVFATVGSLEGTSGGYIFEHLMYTGLLARAIETNEAGAAGGLRGVISRGVISRLVMRAARSLHLAPPAPPWEGAAELWELEKAHPLFDGSHGAGSRPGATPAAHDGSHGAGSRPGATPAAHTPSGHTTESAGGAPLQRLRSRSPHRDRHRVGSRQQAAKAAAKAAAVVAAEDAEDAEDAKGSEGSGAAAEGTSLMPTAEASARFAALPPGSVVVLDGLALLQLVEAVSARPSDELSLVAFEHYPFALECDATPQTRALCAAQEWRVFSRCDRIIAASGVTRAALLATYPELCASRIGVIRPPHRFEPSAAAAAAAAGMTASRKTGGATSLATTTAAAMATAEPNGSAPLERSRRLRPVRSPRRTTTHRGSASPTPPSSPPLRALTPGLGTIGPIGPIGPLGAPSTTPAPQAEAPGVPAPHVTDGAGLSPAREGRVRTLADEVQILLVANAIPRKNIGAVLRVLAALPARGVRAWRLRIAGSLTADPDHVAELRATCDALRLAKVTAHSLPSPTSPAAAAHPRHHTPVENTPTVARRGR